MNNLRPDCSDSIFRDVSKDVKISNIYDYPVWFRIRYLNNMISSTSGNDWSIVNNILIDNTNEYDYNCFDEVSSKEDLEELCNKVIDSYINNRNWRSCICRKCGKEFFVKSKTIFKCIDKKYNIPRICNECKNKDINKVVYSVGDTSTTSMEIAMRKAGLIK